MKSALEIYIAETLCKVN